MDLVTVIIPTYNRFKCLLPAIQSVKNQTYKNLEIIVVNDCSTQKEYYNFDFKKKFGDNFFIIHLPKNSRKIFGYPSPGGHARNIGMMISSGKYIAFLDDDDYFYSPQKIEKQVKAMKETGCKISCTDSFTGKGIFNNNIKLKKYHFKGIYWIPLREKFKKENKVKLLIKMYKNKINIWGKDVLDVANPTCGGSSIIFEKSLIKKAGYFPIVKYCDDYLYWKELIKYSNIVFLREYLTYINIAHGGGRNY